MSSTVDTTILSVKTLLRHCSDVEVFAWQLINAGITSGAKGALDLWRRQSMSSLGSPVAESSADEMPGTPVIMLCVYCFLALF